MFEAPLTAETFVLAPRTIHHAIAVMAGRHAPPLAAVPRRLRHVALREDRLLHDFRVQHRARRRVAAVPAAHFVAVISTVQMAVASPVDRNASVAVALETAGAYCAAQRNRYQTR